jgi:protein SCO1/2
LYKLRRLLPSLAALVVSVLFVLSTLAALGAEPAARTFPARGVILELKPDTSQLVIQHEAITGYMDAMTMPFNLQDPAPLSELKRGDRVTFQLHVTEDKSWVDHFQKIGTVSLPENKTDSKPVETSAPRPNKSLLDYKFTNELGQAVSFNDFRGQAIAITFFYTRCPVPEYCPRLSMNFKEASQKLRAMTNAPTNWHFISVSFDPRDDTPEVLQSYGQRYNYDPAHWSFFTGPEDKIAELARDSGIKTEPAAATINHNFRTLIIDPQGHLQMIFPVSGNLSDQIVSEILKATAKTNQAPDAK